MAYPAIAVGDGGDEGTNILLRCWGGCCLLLGGDGVELPRLDEIENFIVMC